MRYGDTKRGTRTKAGQKARYEVPTSQTFSGSACNMKADSQGPTSIFDPWVCGRDGHGIWDGDNTQVEVVNAGITELTRISPWGSGAALPPATTKRDKANVPLWDQPA